MPIENVFVNKYMKEATSKYRFFKIVVNEATTNVKSLLKDIWLIDLIEDNMKGYDKKLESGEIK